MREIDPQSEPRLTEALRRLAASSPQSAPPELGAGLLGEFRRHHRRRRIRRIGVIGLAACLILTVSLLNGRRPSSGAQNAQNTATPAKSVEVPEKPAVATPVPVLSAAPPVTHKQLAARPKSAKTSTSAASHAFVALPGYDPTVPLDELHVVRVQLPANALWQIGAPVSASAGTHNVTADFVVSQGGTPYAVRLVQ